MQAHIHCRAVRSRPPSLTMRGITPSCVVSLGADAAGRVWSTGRAAGPIVGDRVARRAVILRGDAAVGVVRRVAGGGRAGAVVAGDGLQLARVSHAAAGVDGAVATSLPAYATALISSSCKSRDHKGASGGVSR
jgi:hypothetical protein